MLDKRYKQAGMLPLEVVAGHCALSLEKSVALAQMLQCSLGTPQLEAVS